MSVIEDELDGAARANLSPRGVEAYEAYKADLLARNLPLDEIEQILRGFIWDESESESAEDNPTDT